MAGLLAAVILAVPATGAAHEAPLCPETWNPAQQPIKFDGVPGGWSTAPGTTNESTPQNPDGFFALSTADDHDIDIFDGCPGIGGTDEDNGTGDLITTVASGTNVKFTEANGKEPGFKVMAGNNGNGNGNSTFIDIHVWATGDLWVCDAEDSTACSCCFVPPPPFTPPSTP